MARAVKPRELPDELSTADQERFLVDPDFREARRQEKRGKLPTPSMDRVLRGYKRDWLFGDQEPVPPVNPFPDDMARRLIRKTTDFNLRPIVDEITGKVDLRYPYRKMAARYAKRPAEQFLGTIATETHSVEDRKVLEQGAARMPEHTGDSLQRNLWLKARIAQLREAHLARFLAQPNADWPEGDSTLAVVTDAVADFGYCLGHDQGLGKRYQEDEEGEDRNLVAGLLKSVDADSTLAEHIEHIGLYAADGHPEFLAENLGLIELVKSQQHVRSDYWGERLAVTMEEFGDVLPEEERETDRLIVGWLEELYGSPELGPSSSL